jgi:Na+/proline symporter
MNARMTKLMRIGMTLLALGGVALGLAYASSDIDERESLTMKGSFVAALGVFLFGLGFSDATQQIGEAMFIDS